MLWLNLCCRSTGNFVSFANKKKNNSHIRTKKQVVPGFEPGLFGSKPKVITTTLYNQLSCLLMLFIEAHFQVLVMNSKCLVTFQPFWSASQKEPSTAKCYNTMTIKSTKRSERSIANVLPPKNTLEVSPLWMYFISPFQFLNRGIHERYPPLFYYTV